jgi:hypothetical protein
MEKITYKKIQFQNILFPYKNCTAEKRTRGVTGGWAGRAIAHPVLGRIEGAGGQRRRAALLLAHPVLGNQLRP